MEREKRAVFGLVRAEHTEDFEEVADVQTSEIVDMSAGKVQFSRPLSLSVCLSVCLSLSVSLFALI